MPSKILWTIFAIIAVDMLGIGLIIPVVSPMILNNNSPFLSTDTSDSIRIILQGIALCLYPLFQFFGAPLLGIYSDQKGRKPLLILTLIGTTIGYFLATFSFWIGSFWIFCISRILDGFTGGNISIANAIISDISRQEEKAKNFGMIGAAFGVGMISGPFLGGILSEISYQAPFILAGFLSALNLLIVWKILPETLKTPRILKKQKSLFIGFYNIIKAFSNKKLKILFFILLCYISGFAFFTNFFQVFAIEQFGFKAQDIGMIFGYLGICIIISQGFLLRYVAKYKSPFFWVQTGLFILMGTLFFIPFILEKTTLYLLFAIMAIANGLIFANITSIISEKVDETEQGEIMGIKESLQAIGSAIPAILASVIGSISVDYPLFVAGSLVFIGFLLSIKKKK